MNDLVRFHQPQEDVDTIRRMIGKYDSNGGELHHDNCFYVQNPIPRMDKDYNGNPKEVYDQVQVKFEADCDFLTSYYRDELREKNLDPDYDVRIDHNGKDKNPTYYKAESDVRSYLGYSSRNDESGNKMYHKDEWENDFRIWVIGTSYCHSRQFETKDYEWFNKFKSAQENVILAHKNLFSNVERKMEKLRMGLKSYRYFDQAQELADKLGVVLNESVLNESSSMALSIYSPTNLADLLTDKVEPTKDEKIAIARQLLQEQVNSLN